MTFSNVIFTLLWVAAFIAVLAMAVVGLRGALEPREDSSWTPPRLLRKKKRAGTGPGSGGQGWHDQRSPKRGLFGRKRDQRADLLPADATISFAAEREAADI